MPTKMITSNFAGYKFDSGVIPAGNSTAPPGQMTVVKFDDALFGGRGDDRLYIDGSGRDVSAGRWITYDQHDLRDLLTQGECLANALINVQRMKETPHVIQCYNVPPNQNIYEAVVVTNSKINWQDGELDTSNLFALFKAGFAGISSGSIAPSNRNKMDSQREILYAERRVYAQDTSQQFSAPQSMGQMGGADTSTVPTRWLNNWILMDRTVSGEADLVIGPELNIYRFVWVASYARFGQNVSTSLPNGVPAEEFVERDSQTMIVMPPLVVNVIGEKRKMTETEKAVEYTNVFLSNQNVPSP